MCSKISKILLFILLISGIQQVVTTQEKFTSRRWRLKFVFDKDTKPKRMVITDPLGLKKVYWYFRYKIYNDTERDIPYAVNIKLVIDKTRRGIPESDVPRLFYKGQIPSEITDKQKYINSLRTYYDTDLPLIKHKILSKLKVYPQLSGKEKSILGVLTNEAKSVFEIMKEVELSYSETESALNSLTVNNLAVSQEIAGDPIFVKGTLKNAIFLENDKEVVKEKGDEIAGWEIVSFTRTNVVLKKEDITTFLGLGSTLEYLYTRSNRTPIELDKKYYQSGMSAKGTYKGRTGEEEKKYIFERSVIAKGEIRHGIALFSDVSPEVDFMAIVISGLVDPIVHRYVERKSVVYAYNEVLMLGYEILGDEFSINKQPLSPLYKKWEVLDTKVVRKYD